MKILEDKLFKDITSFHIGGKIRYYAEARNKKELEEAVCFAKSNNLKIFIIGGGSDFLVNDKTYDGMVIKYTGNKILLSGDKITAEAGTSWDKLVEYSIRNDFQGVECLSGIPGTVGAAPIQNIGAYGQEFKDTFVKLTAYDTEKEKFATFDKNDCKFGYRESIFKEKTHWQKFIITDITLKLNKNGKPVANYESLSGQIGSNPTLLEIRNAILKVRRERLEDPAINGNAGSFFKNPIITSDQKNKLEKDFSDVKVFPFEDKFKISAAWLIEKAGWKGRTYKGAGVSQKHSLILINFSGNAKAKDVMELSEMIIDDVYKKFGIELEREVQLINF
jgi:UDP-N-acetylmuramate dehydrogenase